MIIGDLVLFLFDFSIVFDFLNFLDYYLIYTPTQFTFSCGFCSIIRMFFHVDVTSL